MAREYDPVILQKLQQAELGILKDFMAVCAENGLVCFGLAGTGLGVIRHGGFIPWDDDIDIALPRADYEKALEIFAEQYADKYEVVNAERFKNYPLMTTRLCLKDSEFVEIPLKKIDCPLGIFLDIYALDNVAKNEKAHEKQAFTAWLYSKLLILKHIPFPVLPFSGIKKVLAHTVTACAWAVLNGCFVSHDRLYRKAKAASCRYNGEEADALAYFCDTDRHTNFFKKEDLFPLQQLPFEDMLMNFPKNQEQSLRDFYGDFMVLPPVEKRKNHFPYRLRFPGETVVYKEEDEG